jgi:hypothetical protein
MIRFIGTSVTISLNHTYYSAIAQLHNLQFTVAHALGFSLVTTRLLATDLNTETSTSNYYEVSLPFLVQIPWNLGTQLKTLLESKLHCTAPVLMKITGSLRYIRSAWTTQKTKVT